MSDKSRSGLVEGPGAGDYNGGTKPSSSDLKAPHKVYPESSKLGKGDRKSGLVEGPCTGKKEY